MQIGILGASPIGCALAQHWTRLGHDVHIGVLDPEATSLEELHGVAGSRLSVGPLHEAAAEADVLLLATSWVGTEDALTSAGDLGGKILIDSTNPVLPGTFGLNLGFDDSGGERVAQWASGARVVKAFNAVGPELITSQGLAGERPSLFLCGDDLEAKSVVRELAGELGFEAVESGPLENARLLEPMAILRADLAYKRGQGTRAAFRLLHG